MNCSFIIAEVIRQKTVAGTGTCIIHKTGSFVVIVVFWDLDAKLQHFHE